MKSSVIAPETICLNKIVNLFDEAYFGIRSVDHKGNCFLCKELGWGFHVDVLPEKQLISFRCLLGIDIDAPDMVKLKFVNEVSQRYLLINAILLDEDSLAVEHQILYKGGITVRGLLQGFKRFAEISKLIGSEISQRRLAPGTRAAKRRKS